MTNQRLEFGTICKNKKVHRCVRFPMPQGPPWLKTTGVFKGWSYCGREGLFTRVQPGDETGRMCKLCQRAMEAVEEED